MTQRSFPAVYMRGGTSRVVVFKKDDLPSDPALWNEIFLSCMGSPDSHGRQLDGMGGGISSLSKVCVLSPSEREEADVDYTFAQVSVTEAKVDYKGNCGNVSSAVGPFAVMAGWVKPSGSEACVRIFNTNTSKVIHSYFPVKDGEVVFEGDFAIPGVSGTAAPVRLEFQHPGGAVTGKLLPTGSVRDTLKISESESIEVSLLDAANPCVFVRAQDVGLTGAETPAQLEASGDLLEKLDLIRRRGSVEMGIAPDLEAAKNSIAIPYIALVSAPVSDQMNFSMRVIASGQPHKALPLTVSLCAAVAAKIPGTVVSQLANGISNEVQIGMPSGVLTLNADVTQENNQWTAVSGSFFRTARLLFAGRIFG
ncbi:2-methylaconitate cis-trans isomerase PrpF family protein [Bdellovibrio bacteriovorus]|uniref:2-methylaconitate cis-trans isomerase PrpF family protein n=1 Tax=Bdellovibrio bacteriovorus TaxID=959 RepID=UPI003D005552